MRAVQRANRPLDGADYLESTLVAFIDAALRARSPEHSSDDRPAPVGVEPAAAPPRGLRAIPGVGLGLALLSAALAAAAIAWSLSHHASVPAP